MNFLVLAWRSGTIKNYDCQLKKWLYYCTNLNIDPFHPTVGVVLSYLKSLFDAGLSYSAIGTARSALSHIIKFDNAPVGQHPLVKIFMKSVFQQRPALPKKYTWEVNDMLNYLRMLSPADSLTLEQLTKKTLMLIAILSGQRGQTFHKLKVNKHDMSNGTHLIVFRINDMLKTSRPGHHLSELKFKAYPCDRRLCVVTYLHAYIDRTDKFRNDDVDALFICYGKPNGPASRDSIFRWTKDVMRDAGIDLNRFKPHSTRSSGTSAARSFVTLDTILKAGNWSQSSTFTKYYDLPIVESCKMQTAILDRFSRS